MRTTTQVVGQKEVVMALGGCLATIGGFRGGRAGFGLTLGDGLTPSLTVMLVNAKF